MAFEGGGKSKDRSQKTEQLNTSRSCRIRGIRTEIIERCPAEKAEESAYRPKSTHLLGGFTK